MWVEIGAPAEGSGAEVGAGAAMSAVEVFGTKLWVDDEDAAAEVVLELALVPYIVAKHRVIAPNIQERCTWSMSKPYLDWKNCAVCKMMVCFPWRALAGPCQWLQTACRHPTCVEILKIPGCIL